MDTVKHMDKKLDNFWNFIKDNKNTWLFYETDDTVFSLSLSGKYTYNDDNDMEVSYCFQEEINQKQHFVCYGTFVIDTRNNRIKSSTVIDKYNDCFEPSMHDILSTFFEVV